jgi:SWI/SNF related-matrix-associated actin-dependent regulator of chromatin subfamily C
LSISLGKLKEIVKRHQGLIAETEAEATHLVYSAADPLEEEYARPLFRRDRNTLLHWYISVKTSVLKSSI